MSVSLPQEVLFAIGILLFATALVFFGIILRALLQLIQSKSIIWVLPFISTIFVLIFALFHFHTSITYLPKLTPGETEMIRMYFRFQFYGSLTLFVASVLALIASGTYFWRTSR